MDKLRDELKVSKVTDNSTYNYKEEKTITVRSVYLSNESGTIKIRITKELEKHPLDEIEVGDNVKLTLEIGSFQKKVTEYLINQKEVEKI